MTQLIVCRFVSHEGRAEEFGLKVQSFGTHHQGCSRVWTEVDGVTHFFVWNYIFCRFYVHFWPCRRL